jgi:hypothetical protein
LQLTVVNVIVSGVSPTSGIVGSTVVISGSGFTGATAVQFNGTAATSFTVNNDGQITATVPAGATSGTISVIKGSCSGFSTAAFAIITTNPFTVQVYLQGYWDAITHTMVPALLNQGISTNANETDSILIEFRDTVVTTNVVYSATGVLSTSGLCTINIPSSLMGNRYYVVVKHRNSVQMWSSTSILFNSAVTGYNFIFQSNVFGGNVVEVEPGSGWYGMYSGDINQDEFVDPFDYPTFELDNFSFAGGYLATDLNGDGFIDPFDYPVFELNNFNFVMSAHP